jgi:PHD/YefM family antitoxin component YafN of YafNO toxin-antitoxin module
MIQIIPIKDLEKTKELSELCRKVKEPIYIAENGYVDMVIMSLETYERTMVLNDLYRKLEQGGKSIEADHIMDVLNSISEARKKYES